MGNHRLLRFINRHGHRSVRNHFLIQNAPIRKSMGRHLPTRIPPATMVHLRMDTLRIRPKVICLPIKRYWSMNGKNVNADGKGIAVPFGILEAFAFAATAGALFYFNKAACLDTPIAYADASKLLLPMPDATGAFLGKAVVRSHTDYPSFLGSYIDERAKARYGKLSSEASEFTLLDKDLLEALVANCGDGSKTYGGVSYNENDIASWSANANFTSSDVCDFITFTENCVCAGVYSAQAWVDCVGTSDRVMKDDGAGGYVEDDTTSPLCAKHGGLDKYIDTRAISKKSTYQLSLRRLPHRSHLRRTDELFSIRRATFISMRTQKTRRHVGQRLASWFVMSNHKHGGFGHVHQMGA